MLNNKEMAESIITALKDEGLNVDEIIEVLNETERMAYRIKVKKDLKIKEKQKKH